MQVLVRWQRGSVMSKSKVKELKKMGCEEEKMSKDEVQKMRQRIMQNAASENYHTLLPISVQQSLKSAVRQYVDNEQKKRIAIDEVTARAQRGSAHCFKE